MESLPISKKELLKVTFPKILTHKQAEEYAASKIATERSQFRSYEWDKPRHDPYLQLLASQRVLKRTEKALDARKEFIKGERIKLNDQWKDLFEKEEKLKETFRKLNTFIISNQEKRERATIRCQEDAILTQKRTTEIEKLQAKISEALEYTTEVEQNINTHRMYEQYLNEVVGVSNEFKNADDLLSRYEALSSTRNELGKRQDAALKEVEQARLKTSKMSEENGFIILGLNNMVADLRTRYSLATRKALHWETVVHSIKDRLFEKSQELNEVKQASWNIYILMCKRKGESPKLTENDFEKQLLYVKKTLQELSTVKELALGSITFF